MVFSSARPKNLVYWSGVTSDDWFGIKIVSTSVSWYNECDGNAQIMSQIYSGRGQEMHAQCREEIQCKVEVEIPAQCRGEIQCKVEVEIPAQCIEEIQCKVELEWVITSKLDARFFAPPLRVSTPISRVIDRRLYHAAAAKAELQEISFQNQRNTSKNQRNTYFIIREIHFKDQQSNWQKALSRGRFKQSCKTC